MINKKFKLVFIFVFMIINLFFIDNIKAYSCKYEGDGVTAKVIVDNTYGAIEEVKIGKRKEKIANWENSYAGFNAGSYQFSNLCPEYLIFYYCDGTGPANFEDLYVSDEAHKDAIMKKEEKDCDPFSGYPKVLKLTEQPKKEDTGDKAPNSCLDFPKVGDSKAEEGTAQAHSCENNPYFSCLWIEETSAPGGGYCNTDKLQYVYCGDAVDIPPEVPNLISFFVNLLKIATPIILIFVSIITLFKAIVASKDDEIKKAQSSLIKKIIAAVMVFFVISIVQFVINKAADSTETKNISECLNCFLNNDCAASTYYKTNVSGEYQCHSLDGSEIDCETGN